MMNVKLLKCCQSKRRTVCSRGHSEAGNRWYNLHLMQENNSIPRDVPKGHLAVYVGENCTRYIIKISLLNHPLFKALLDVARDVYGFATCSKLCIPCDEYEFLEVLRCASHSDDRKCCFCP